MSKGHQVVDLTALRGNVRSTRGGLEIDGQRVALADVGVLLLGARSTISGGALTMLSKYQVVVLNCDWRGVPDGVFTGWSSASRIAARHRAQAELTLPRRKMAWQQIVKAKIKGQQGNLAYFNRVGVNKLERFAKQVRSGDPENIEAQAAHEYWTSLFDSEFRRVPGAKDDVNSLLNYGYTVLRGFVIRGISSAGLCPTYSIWHRNRSNTFALADDLIEPFRPAVDFAVASLPSTASLEDRQVKAALVNVSTTPVSKQGASIQTAINELALQLGRFVEAGVDKLAVPTWIPSNSGSLECEGDQGG
jgi:CRISPR-associated protein Cas1